MKKMHVIFPIFLAINILFMSGTALSETNDIEKVSGPYLGQKPPGKKPEIFAPMIISTEKNEGCLIFAKDGKRLLLELGSNMFEMIEKDRHWTDPKIVSFQDNWNVNDITFAPDGKTVFFASRRPIVKNGAIEDYSNLWKSEMKSGKWTAPQPLPSSINTPLHESYATAAGNGALYFFRFVLKPGIPEKGDLFVSNFKDGKYTEPEPFDDNFNTPYHEWDPYIAPDESYLIFCSMKPEGLGQDDLYISFKKKDGTWTSPVNMGEEINSSVSENRPFVTLDGKYLFFTSNRINASEAKNTAPSQQAQVRPGLGSRDVYWVDASIIEEMKAAAFKAEEAVPDFKAMKIADNAFLFEGNFSNVLAVNSNVGIILIDIVEPAYVSQMYKSLYIWGQKQARYLITSHYHSDHTGGNEFLGRRGITIISHVNAKNRMQSEQYNDFFDYRVPALPEHGLPQMTFGTELRLQLGEEELLLSYAPGHTDGDITAYFRKANIIHMGDIFFNGYLPTYDVAAGGSIDKMIESVQKTLSLINDSTIVIPGHGKQANKAALAEFLDFLKTLRNTVSDGIEKGMTAEEIISTRPDYLYKRNWLNVSQTPDILIKNVYLDLIRFKK